METNLLLQSSALKNELNGYCILREFFCDWIERIPCHYFLGPSFYSQSKWEAGPVDFKEITNCPSPSSVPFRSVPILYDDDEIANSRDVWDEYRQNAYLKVVEIVRSVLGTTIEVKVFGSSVNGFG